MIGIIRCNEGEISLLQSREEIQPQNEKSYLTTNRPRKDWKKSAGLVILTEKAMEGDEVISRIGWASKVRQIDDLNEKLDIYSISRIPRTLEFNAVVSDLTKRERGFFIPEGIQTDGTGRAIISALVRQRPEVAKIIKQLQSARDRYPITSMTEQIVADQRDATIMAGRMAGFDIPALAEWEPPNTFPPDDDVGLNYLNLLSNARAFEDHLINHDARTVHDWVRRMVPDHNLSWQLFKQDDQQLLVGNVNRTAAETTLGVDLIYYNLSRKSLVLVQYKKVGTDRFYRPKGDKNLDKELNRMRVVDDFVARNKKATDSFRLHTGPSWLKICQSSSSIPRSDELVHGMYLAREHFEQLREDKRLRGSKDGVIFGFSTVPNYLDNTTFIRLVETGFIGTAETSTELLKALIYMSLDNQKALVFAILSGEEILQTKRTSDRRSSLSKRTRAAAAKR